jgi:hypothetical protein
MEDTAILGHAVYFAQAQGRRFNNEMQAKTAKEEDKDQPTRIHRRKNNRRYQ